MEVKKESVLPSRGEGAARLPRYRFIKAIMCAIRSAVQWCISGVRVDPLTCASARVLLCPGAWSRRRRRRRLVALRRLARRRARRLARRHARRLGTVFAVRVTRLVVVVLGELATAVIERAG